MTRWLKWPHIPTLNFSREKRFHTNWGKFGMILANSFDTVDLQVNLLIVSSKCTSCSFALRYLSGSKLGNEDVIVDCSNSIWTKLSEEALSVTGGVYFKPQTYLLELLAQRGPFQIR
eukprot:m.27206 g.27206  ORF g.27206 m.27206 type:complete len:117 (+) comp29855_c0_seq1:594-944(+)